MGEFHIGCSCLITVGLSFSELLFEIGPCLAYLWFCIPFFYSSAKIFALVMVILPMLMRFYGFHSIC